MAATDSDQQIRVGIVEDHADLRAALEQTLQSAPDFCLSFSAEDLAQARRLMVQDFDLLILDLSLPDGLGTTLIPDLRRRLRPPEIVAHTVFDDEGSVIRAIEAGVDGYVLKSTAAEALFAALHAAMRGEKITAIFINNAIYGMTGGQMAPTTLLGQKATTAPLGRQKEHYGMPIRMAELLSTLDGCVYAERVAAVDVPNILKAKKAVKKAFELQNAGAGFTFVEVLSTCPTNWGLTPLEAVGWLKENMIPYYPLGVYADRAEAK